MMSEQRHVNTAMRDLAAGIADLQTTVVKFWESSTRVKPSNEGKTLKGNPHMVERASQTSPEREADKRGSVYKRVREESHKSRRFSPKRHKGPPQIRVPHKLMLPDPGQGHATAGGESTPTTAPVTRGDTPSSKLQKWQLVDRKSKRERIERRHRPDVIIIQPQGNLIYSDMLRMVTRRQDDKLKAVCENVNRVRRTAKGDLLLELKSVCSSQQREDERRHPSWRWETKWASEPCQRNPAWR
ncbi:GL10788 [Drosophila persimilis]|uniref:GL10788 n=1 Tax=Drosophila persimilis TaxID=7234 RepID=B4IRP0_DROPE|nr:GL10788 [Drosophila persimilis]